MKKIIIFALLIFSNMVLYSQVHFEKNKANKLNMVKYTLSDSEEICVLFGNDGQVSTIYRFKFNKKDGFQYYFTKNKLDSIRRFSNGIANLEFYQINSKGYLDKHILPNGYDLDSFFYLKQRTNESQKAVKLSIVGYNKVYELDSIGKLIRVYDCDSNFNEVSGYSIYITNGYFINQIISQEGETILIKDGYLEGIYSYKNNLPNGFRLLFTKNRNRLLKELIVIKDNKTNDAHLFFNKKGKIKTTK